MAITVNTVLTTAKKLTAVKMVSASTLAETSSAIVGMVTSENTASTKQTNVQKGRASTTQRVMMLSIILAVLVLMGMQEGYARTTLMIV